MLFLVAMPVKWGGKEGGWKGRHKSIHLRLRPKKFNLALTCVFVHTVGLYSADYRMVKMLLSRGAQVNVCDVSGNTPLHTATIYGHTELVKLLLQHSAEVYTKGQHGALAIHMAAREGHANLVRLFCQFAEVLYITMYLFTFW